MGYSGPAMGRPGHLNIDKKIIPERNLHQFQKSFVDSQSRDGL
jgi:hypothetical protein